MDSMSWPVLVDRICDALAIAMPVICMRLEGHAVPLGAMTFGVLFSVPQMVILALDPDRAGGAHFHFHGGPLTWIAMSLITGLVYSALLLVMREAFRIARVLVRRYLLRDRAPRSARALPVARDVTGSSTRPQTSGSRRGSPAT